MLRDSYRWYRFKCWLFGHKYSCCSIITRRCSKCVEGQLLRKFALYFQKGKEL